MVGATGSHPMKSGASDSLNGRLNAVVPRSLRDQLRHLLLDSERGGIEQRDAVEQNEGEDAWARQAELQPVTGSTAAQHSLSSRLREMRQSLASGQAFVEEIHIDVVLSGFTTVSGGELDESSLFSALTVDALQALLEAAESADGLSASSFSQLNARSDDANMAYVMRNVGQAVAPRSAADRKSSRNVGPRADRAVREPLLVRRRIAWHVQLASEELDRSLAQRWDEQFQSSEESEGGGGSARLLPSNALDTALSADAADRHHEGFLLYILNNAAHQHRIPYAYATPDPSLVPSDEQRGEDASYNLNEASISRAGLYHCLSNVGVSPLVSSAPSSSSSSAPSISSGTRFAWIDLSAGPVSYGPGSSGLGYVSSNLTHPYATWFSRQSGIDLLVHVLGFAQGAVEHLFAPPMAHFPIPFRRKLTILLLAASPSASLSSSSDAAYEDRFNAAGSRFRWTELRAALRELAPESVLEFRRVDLQLPALNDNDDLESDLEAQQRELSRRRRRTKGETEPESHKARAARLLNMALTLSRREQVIASHVDGSVLLRTQYLDSAVLGKHLHRFAQDIFSQQVTGIDPSQLTDGSLLPILLFNFGDDRNIRLLDQHEQAVTLTAPLSSSSKSFSSPLVVAVQTAAGRVISDYTCSGSEEFLSSSRSMGGGVSAGSGGSRTVNAEVPTDEHLSRLYGPTTEINAVIDLRDATRAIFAQVAEAAWGIAPTHLTWPRKVRRTLGQEQQGRGLGAGGSTSAVTDDEHGPEFNYVWSLQRTPFGLFGGGKHGRAPLEASFVQKEAASRHVVYSLVNQTLSDALAVFDRLLLFDEDVREGDGGPVSLSPLHWLLSDRQAKELQRRYHLLVFKLGESSRSVNLRLYQEAVTFALAAERDARAMLFLLKGLQDRTASALLCPASHSERQRSSNAAANLALVLVAFLLLFALTVFGLLNGVLPELGLRMRRFFVSRQKKND